MWTYFFGPFVAIFPKPWRESLRLSKLVHWGRATAISGFAQAAIALVALTRWYAHAMFLWVGNGAAYALSGKMGTEVRFQDIGGAALFVWATHPVTWLIAGAGIEGLVRLWAGAFDDSGCGILPLYLADKIVAAPFRRGNGTESSPQGVRGNVSSIAGALRERLRAASAPEVSDEICFANSESGEILEIHACRRKQDWNPPRLVRCFDAYYRLESESSAAGTRPFRYLLRRLPAGVPGRSVLLYAPADAIVRDVAKK